MKEWSAGMFINVRHGTCLPISLKSKSPLNPKTKAANVIRSFASGGCTSTKYRVLMYLPANLPKCTSSKLSTNGVLLNYLQNELIPYTYTTLLGFESLKSLTADATNMMTIKSFHSPDVRWSPPGGKYFVRPGPSPFDAAALRASASRWSSRWWGNRWEVESGGCGEAGRRTRALGPMPTIYRVFDYRVLASNYGGS